MVGGGYAQDNLMFSGKDGSDFHKCKLIDIAGFAVSTEFAEANGVVQPLPNPAYTKPDQSPERPRRAVPRGDEEDDVVWGELDRSRQQDQMIAVGETVEGYGSIDPISYDAIGAQDYNLLAQKVKDSGRHGRRRSSASPATSRSWPRSCGSRTGRACSFADANQYDDLALTTSGPDAVEGVQGPCRVPPLRGGRQVPGDEAAPRHHEPVRALQREDRFAVEPVVLVVAAVRHRGQEVRREERR